MYVCSGCRASYAGLLLRRVSSAARRLDRMIPRPPCNRSSRPGRGYLRGDYERTPAFEQPGNSRRYTPPDNPLRYDILKASPTFAPAGDSRTPATICNCHRCRKHARRDDPESRGPSGIRGSLPQHEGLRPGRDIVNRVLAIHVRASVSTARPCGRLQPPAQVDLDRTERRAPRARSTPP